MSCSEIKDFTCHLFTSENLYLFGGLLLLIVILILIRKRQPKNVVAYKTENGNVIISRSAVVELVRTTCEQISQINKPKLKVFTKRGQTHFTVCIQLMSGSSLKDVEETLQNHLRESLSKNLGIENLGTINIVVTSFKSSKVRPFNSENIIKSHTALPQAEESSDETQEELKPSDKHEDQ